MDVIKYVYKNNKETIDNIRSFGTWYLIAYAAFAYMSLQLNPLLWCDPARVGFAVAVLLPIIIYKLNND